MHLVGLCACKLKCPLCLFEVLASDKRARSFTRRRKGPPRPGPTQSFAEAFSNQVEALQEESRSAKAVLEEAPGGSSAGNFSHWHRSEEQRKQEEEVAELERRGLIAQGDFLFSDLVRQTRSAPRQD